MTYLEKITEAVARAMHAHEWKDSNGCVPFECDREYWLAGAKAAIDAINAALDEHRTLYVERCIACQQPMVTGQKFYSDASGGFVHASCCGPEREGYTDRDGEPLQPGQPVPYPGIWS